MSFFAALGDVRVVEARVTIPVTGAFHADVTLEKEATPTETTTLSLGGLSLKVTPWRPPRAFQGRTHVRLIGGFGKWRDEIPAASYHAVTKLSLILGDAAKACGEKIEVHKTKDRKVGTHFLRAKGPAAACLNWLAPEWWIDVDGTTKVEDRPSTMIASTFTIVDVRGDRGSVVVATEKPADFTPGRRFKGPKGDLVIQGVTHTLAKDSLRTEILL